MHPGYYEELHKRIRVYKRRYPTPTAFVILKLLWWNLKSLFRRSPLLSSDMLAHIAAQNSNALYSLYSQHPKRSIRIKKPSQALALIGLAPSLLNVAFMFAGGLGDLLIAANFLHKFRQKYASAPLRLDVFACGNYEDALFVFENKGLAQHVYPQELYEFCSTNYDCFIALHARFPHILHADTKKIAALCPEMLEYVFACLRFKAEHSRFFEEVCLFDGQSAMLALLKGKSRIQQPDVYGVVGLSQTFEYEIPLRINENAFKKTLNLLDRPFITLHRGSNVQYSKNAVRLWPQTHYAILIRLLKKRYPHILLVQTGVSHDRCPEMKGVDLNLAGQTNLEQLACLLRHSLLHIDSEGGVVHLRQALHAGPSVVLFGPTCSSFYGYANNINLRGNGCKICCEWATSQWLNSCLRGYSTPPCMASLIPERVFERLCPVLDTLLSSGTHLSALQRKQDRSACA